MKLLLTSGGINNPSIENALLELLGKPFAECNALVVPTATYAHPYAGPRQAWKTVSGTEHRSGLVGFDWKTMGILELTALPSLGEDRWLPLLRETDVLLVDGGDAAYLCHWMRESGLAELLPSLDLVWVGVSAGSMVMTPRTGIDFITWHPEDGDTMLGMVDFSIYPHVDNPDLPWNTMTAAEEWAAGIDNPAYAIDDATAFKIVDGTVDVVSEGTWKLLHA
jgi:dipeptidase E